jgi:hypothetical protein
MKGFVEWVGGVLLIVFWYGPRIEHNDRIRKEQKRIKRLNKQWEKEQKKSTD